MKKIAVLCLCLLSIALIFTGCKDNKVVPSASTAPSEVVSEEPTSSDGIVPSNGTMPPTNGTFPTDGTYPDGEQPSVAPSFATNNDNMPLVPDAK